VPEDERASENCLQCEINEVALDSLVFGLLVVAVLIVVQLPDKSSWLDRAARQRAASMRRSAEQSGNDKPLTMTEIVDFTGRVNATHDNLVHLLKLMKKRKSLR
jgi:5-bromo-4-chloroindolyl phosphate hydrolysis protein